MSVTPNIVGGLGNQLFIIAVAYSYSLKHNLEFNIEPRKNCGNRPTYFTNLLTHLSEYFKGYEKVKSVEYKEPKFSYTEIPKLSGHIVLNGYFQSEKYFRDYENEIRHLFRLTPNTDEFLEQKLSVLKNNTTLPIVAIHIRRGDYLNLSQTHTVQTKEYYETAKKVIEGKLGMRPAYFYFSDDKAWVMDTFVLGNMDRIVNLYTDSAEFGIMRKCDHFIIANSSFSWWAAWLSKTPKDEKIVIAPKNWFGPDGPQDWQDVYCQSWIVI